MNGKEPLFLTATEYWDSGLNVIPIPHRKKAARVHWKKYQRERVPRSKVERWFREKLKNIAIVLGDVSSCAVRDFDDPKVYSKWADNHPELANLLPTVATGAGFHVYAGMSPMPGLKPVEGGELRGNGAYVCAPPSVHPSGRVYEWKIPFRLPLPVVTLEDLDLDHLGESVYRSSTEANRVVQKPDRRELTTEAISEVSGVRRKPKESAQNEVFSTRVESIIQTCLPSDFGQRERKLFELARRLLPFCTEMDLATTLSVFDHWWEKSKDIVGTKNYETSMNAFLRAVERAETPLEDIVANCAARAASKPCPDWARQFNPQTQLLASLCRELQANAGDDPFFLSCRSAARIIGVSHTHANMLLGLFERLMKISVVKRGVPGGKHATRYRYVE